MDDDNLPDIFNQRQRAIGSLLGLAIGNALGAPLNGKDRDTHEPITDVIGDGPRNLKPGEWTNDVSMALAVSASLLKCGELDESDLMIRFWNVVRRGEYRCTEKPITVDPVTMDAIRRWEKVGNPIAGLTAPETAGDGSLVRVAPVAIRFWRDWDRLREAAERQSRVTHGAVEAVHGCIVFAEILAGAIEGQTKEQVLQTGQTRLAPAVQRVVDGSWKAKSRDEIRSPGRVFDTLEAALWCFDRSSSFEEAVMLAANLGDDADTVAAVTGQLAGAFYGASAIPDRFLAKLAWRDRIEQVAEDLFDVDMFSDVSFD
ncbi:MAG: ADP-ribosylglycohydrolase family protein [Rhizobiaceae bacterium]